MVMIIVIIAIIQECVTEAINYGKCLQNKNLHKIPKQATFTLFGTLTVQKECVKDAEENLTKVHKICSLQIERKPITRLNHLL